MVKFKMPDLFTMTFEVTKVDADTVTRKVTTIRAHGRKPDVQMETVLRFLAKGEADKIKLEGKRLPDQALTVGGKKVTCEVYEETKGAFRRYICKDVPGWVVKLESSNETGTRETIMELIEYRK